MLLPILDLLETGLVHLCFVVKKTWDQSRVVKVMSAALEESGDLLLMVVRIVKNEIVIRALEEVLLYLERYTAVFLQTSVSYCTSILLRLLSPILSHYFSSSATSCMEVLCLEIALMLAICKSWILLNSAQAGALLINETCSARKEMLHFCCNYCKRDRNIAQAGQVVTELS